MPGSPHGLPALLVQHLQPEGGRGRGVRQGRTTQHGERPRRWGSGRAKARAKAGARARAKARARARA